MRIAFQGEIGAFSEQAVRAFAPEAMPVSFPSFEAVFEALVQGAVDRGVVPIENSLFGSVHVNYDLLQAHPVRITGELKLRIVHHLMALPGETLATIEEVRSHPQALGQCQAFLKTHLSHARQVPVYDTAGAARQIAEERLAHAAAIASAAAAEEYGLEILARGIESDYTNYTRFLLLAHQEEAFMPSGEGPFKTSIVYAMKENVPGALFKSLAVFALRDIDLLKIESRPLVGRPWAYLFYLDFTGSLSEPVVQRALGHLEEITAYLKILGSYPVGPEF